MAIAVAFVATACAWGQAGGNAARNSANPFEIGLTPDNVGQLALSWQADGVVNEPVMDAKYLYGVTLDGKLNAYAAGGPASADGAGRCSGTTVVCTPVWFARLSQFSPGIEVAVSGDQVFTVAFVDGAVRLMAFDADPESCPATPDGCVPLWTGQWRGPVSTSALIAVADGRVYVGSAPDISPGAPYVVAFDERGITNCTAGPPRACSPLFRTSSGVPAQQLGPGYLAIAGGRLVTSGIGPQSFVFDATGQLGCTNGVCSPLYRLDTGGLVSISGTTAYAVGVGGLLAFDVTGTNGCSGTPRVCHPVWTGLHSKSALFTQPTISNGRVFVAQEGNPIDGPAVEAFDAAGVEGCSGTPVVCLPLWGVSEQESASYPNELSATPSLLIMSGSTMKTFDLAGVGSCSGTPKRCAALSSAPIGNTGGSRAAAVAFGRIAVIDFGGHLKVFAIPG